MYFPKNDIQFSYSMDWRLLGKLSIKGFIAIYMSGEVVQMQQAGRIGDARWLLASLIVSNLVKFGTYGFRYYPVLDDYIQYHNYGLYEDVVRDVFLRTGTLCSRPLAGIFDAFVWGRLWGRMGAALLLITLLHAAAIWLLYRVFARTDVPCGRVFLVFCALYPLLSEATYWISASSRLVVGVFFAALAVFLLCKYYECGKAVFAAGFAICNLLSYGFYEQVIVVSCLLALFVVWSYRRSWWVAAIPLGNLLLIGIYYIACRSTGVNAARSALSADVFGHLQAIWEQVLAAVGTHHWELLQNSLVRGLALLRERWWYGGMIVLSAMLLAFAGGPDTARRNGRKAVLALLLIAAPFAPFLILEHSHISFRNLFLSFFGIALLADMVFSGRAARAAAGILAALFLVCNVSELHDYRAVSQTDAAICRQIVPYVGDGSRPVYLVGAKSCYVPLNTYFHEHIHNVTQSDWALTGAVRSYAENVSIQKVIPVPAGYTAFEPDAIVLDIDQNGTVILR